MEQLLQWVKKLAVFMILSGYMEHLLPSGYRRYFHMCMGLILIMMIGTPLLRVMHAPLGTDFNYLLADLKIGSSVYQFEGDSAKSFQDYYMKQYREAVEEQIRQMAQAQNMSVASIDLNVEEDIESEQYGRLLQLEIAIQADEDTSSKIAAFRETLANQLGMDRQSILVNVE